MSITTQRITDALFVIQVGCALLFGATQVTRMLTTTEGVSLTWFLFWALFLFINLRLAIRAHQVYPTRLSRQTIITYVAWSVVLAGAVGVLLWRSLGQWEAVDTLNMWVSGVGIGLVLAIGRLRGLGIADPLVRGWLAVFFKGTPQLTLAWHILQNGGEGLAPFAILSGHITINLRIGQLVFALREAGWDRNRLGSALSEVANELSWVVTTVAWLAVR